MPKATLETLMVELKKVVRSSEATTKKLSDIEKRIKVIETDIKAIKKFVATDNANFKVKATSSSKTTFPLAAAPSK